MSKKKKVFIALLSLVTITVTASIVIKSVQNGQKLNINDIMWDI